MWSWRQEDKVPSSYSAKHKNRDQWELIGTDWQEDEEKSESGMYTEIEEQAKGLWRIRGKGWGGK